jgi:rRNA large subunit m3Psi methyltransferase RlmH
MRLLLVAAGTRLPHWVNAGYEEYAQRLRGEFRLELKEIPLGQRSGGDDRRAVVKEGERMLAALPANTYVVALQVHGRALSSEQLATFLQARANEGRDVAFCIGGPEGCRFQVVVVSADAAAWARSRRRSRSIVSSGLDRERASLPSRVMLQAEDCRLQAVGRARVRALLSRLSSEVPWRDRLRILRPRH